MSNNLSVIALPDGVSVSREAILRASLYFDAVYLDAFVPKLNTTSFRDGSLTITFSRWFPIDKDLSALKDSGVLRDVPQTVRSTVRSFSSRELSLPVREAVAASMRQGTTLMGACLMSIGDMMQTQTTGQSEVRLPYRFTISDPANLDDSRVEMAICLHLASLFHMLGVCAEGDIRPLVDRPEHARLISSLATEFPAVSRALGIEVPRFEAKHTAVSLKVLDDTLPDLRAGSAEDVLALREEMSEELCSFRAEVARLTTTVSSQPWEPSFNYEVEQMIARDVLPSLDNLKRRLANPSKRMVKHLVSDWRSIVTGAGVPLAAWLMNGATLPWAILGGVSAGLGIAALQAKVEEWSVRNESALTFVLEAGRRLGKEKGTF